MFQIASNKDNQIFINTLLSETEFAKTQFTRYMTEKGYVVSKDNDGCFSIFDEWRFSEVTVIENQVYFSGKSFDGNFVSELSDESLIKKSLFSIVQAMEKAKNKGLLLPCVSIYGIFISKDMTKLLFLPENAFKKSAEHLSKREYSVIQNSWIDSALSGKKALSFLQATVAYYALCNELPYPPSEKEEQSVNIYDKNFLPLKYRINGIDEKLLVIDETLGNSSYKNKGEEIKEMPFPVDQFEKELFHPEEKSPSLSEEDFLKERERFLKKQKINLKTGRFLRRNKVIAITCAVVFAAALFVYFGIKNERSGKPTVIGLDSTRTTLVFYKGLHTMDADLMKIAAKDCSGAQLYIQNVPLLFTTHMIASSYNYQAGVCRPVSWFFFEPMSVKAYSHAIYGLTNFTIDENPSLLDESVPTLKNHPAKQKSEDGKVLKQNTLASHEVHYYLVHTFEGKIRVEDTTTKVTLEFDGEKWQFSDMEENAEITDVSPIDLSKDLKEALEKSEGNVPLAVDSMREKYFWLPSMKELLSEEHKVQLQG